MNKIIKSLVFVTAITGFSLVSTDANAIISSVTGSGTLNNIGDSISGVFDLGIDTVDYTLTLDNISGISRIDWNGQRFSESSPNPGWSFNAGSSPSLTDTWTTSLVFSEPVTFDWEQTVRDRSGNNNGASQFSINWIGASSSPTISDPDDQLQEESTAVGVADFRISTNPGSGGNTLAGGRVLNNADTWIIGGVPASEVQITWSVAEETSAQNEWITINGISFESATVAAVPEFSPTLGLLAFGGIFSLNRWRKKLTANKITN